MNVFSAIRDDFNMLEGGREGGERRERCATTAEFYITPSSESAGREVCPPDPNVNPRWAVLRSESEPQRSKSPEAGRSMFGVGETVKQGGGKGDGHWAGQVTGAPPLLVPFSPRLSRLLECQASNTAAVTIGFRGPLCSPPSLPLPAPSVPVVPRCPRAGGRAAVKEQRSSENCAG